METEPTKALAEEQRGHLAEGDTAQGATTTQEWGENPCRNWWGGNWDKMEFAGVGTRRFCLPGHNMRFTFHP